MRHRSLAGFAVAALAAGPALAQTPQTQGSTQRGSDGSSGGAEPSSSWTLAGTVAQAYDTNLSFQEPAEGGFVERLGASLDRRSRSAVGEYGLSLGGRLRVHPSASEFDGLDWNLGLTATRQLSSRLQVRGGGGYTSSYARESPLLAEQVLLLETTRTHTTRASGGLSYSVSAHATVSSDVSYGRVGFADEAVGTFPNGLRDGSMLSISNAFQRELGTRDRLGAVHTYGRSDSEGPLSHKNALQAQWARRISEDTSFNVLAGAALVDHAGESSVSPELGASVVSRAGRGSLSANYAHTTGQAFGSGRDRVVDTLAAQYSAPVQRRLSLSATATYARGHSLEPRDTLSHENVSGRFGFTLTFARRASLTGSYEADHRFSTALWPSATRHLFTVSISHGHTWE